MAPISSPILFPASPPSGKKRTRNDTFDAKPQYARPRVVGGFLLDNESDGEENDADALGPSPKRRIAESPPPSSISEQTSNTAQLNGAISENTSDRITEIDRPLFLDSIFSATSQSYKATTCDGRTQLIQHRTQRSAVSYERLVAGRSVTKEGRAKRSYYGVDIHELAQIAAKEIELKTSRPSDAAPPAPLALDSNPRPSRKQSLLWTEKYRARTFVDLCGDDASNRQVLRWLKRWDPIVFPGAKRPGLSNTRRVNPDQVSEEEKPHRKILLLTGPPGLGKTTLAHVCVRQAGYEVLEVNASDDRSRDVVKNRIRTSLGTESVKTVTNMSSARNQKPNVARPTCVVVDEVDGVVTGAGPSGEGGFVRALIDLVLLDQKNAANIAKSGSSRRKKGDDFRQMRPLILICNDVYHASLRPLRTSGLADVVHVGKPTIDSVVNRLKAIFEKEGIPCQKDAARKLCEVAWGMSGGLDAKRGAENPVEGDLRGVMVVGEWVAGRFRASFPPGDRQQLTRQWIEEHVLHDLLNGGGGGRGLGRGGIKDIVNRVFREGAGFPKVSSAPIDDERPGQPQNEQPRTQLSFSEYGKKNGMAKLGQMVETCGEIDRVMTEILTEYPNRDFNDDCYLSKPNQAYDWMHFLDSCSTRLYGNQDWELAQYMSHPILACHDMFASNVQAPAMNYDTKWGDAEVEDSPAPFSGPRANFLAFEAEKHNRAVLQSIQSDLPPTLLRSFRSVEDISSQLLPYLTRLISPDVKPVVVGGSGDQKGTASVRKESERAMVRRAAEVMAEIGISLERGKIEVEGRGPQWVYRMEPDLDELSTYESLSRLTTPHAPTRYAVRQVLDQELQRVTLERDNAARQARFQAGRPTNSNNIPTSDDKENNIPNPAPSLPGPVLKRDFFGRIITETKPLSERSANATTVVKEDKSKVQIWVKFNEGFNNAVRKPMSLQDFLRGL